MTLGSSEAGIEIGVRASDPHPPRIPEAPAGTRVADLWHYDVVECFLVGAQGRYLEVEIGAGGHFLLLSFREPRRRSDDHVGVVPRMTHAAESDGWRASLTVPWQLVPDDLRALNAFAIARGRHLAYHPLPGEVPDFHQPDRYPAATLD